MYIMIIGRHIMYFQIQLVNLIANQTAVIPPSIGATSIFLNHHAFEKFMAGREHALLPSAMKATGPTILQAETCVSAFQVDETTSGSKRYVFIMVLTALYVCAEIFVALYTNSLALLSDAFHNLGDVGALFIAMYCEKVC